MATYRRTPHALMMEPPEPVEAGPDEWESDEIQAHMVCIVETLCRQVERLGEKPKLDKEDVAVMYEATRWQKLRTAINRWGWLDWPKRKV